MGGFEERMRLYGRAREYWAWADHGLEEWVWRAAAGEHFEVVCSFERRAREVRRDEKPTKLATDH